MAHLLNLLILSIGPGINSLIIVLRGNWARRAESRRLVIGGYRQWIEHILTIQNKLNNISEVYITSVIWSRLMETYKQDFYSLRAIWHAQGKFCVNLWSNVEIALEWVFKWTSWIQPHISDYACSKHFLRPKTMTLLLTFQHWHRLYRWWSHQMKHILSNSWCR